MTTPTARAGAGTGTGTGTAVSSPTNGAAGQSCARPGCRQPVVRNARGRPRLYCSPACRIETYRQTPPGARQPLIVEVDHGSTSSRGRPAGHVWLVRLRRGPHEAIVATGLGRPSAEHLAQQLRDVINPPLLTTPPHMR